MRRPAGRALTTSPQRGRQRRSWAPRGSGDRHGRGEGPQRRAWAAGTASGAGGVLGIAKAGRPWLRVRAGLGASVGWAEPTRPVYAPSSTIPAKLPQPRRSPRRRAETRPTAKLCTPAATKAILPSAFRPQIGLWRRALARARRRTSRIVGRVQGDGRFRTSRPCRARCKKARRSSDLPATHIAPFYPAILKSGAAFGCTFTEFRHHGLYVARPNKKVVRSARLHIRHTRRRKSFRVWVQCNVKRTVLKL